LDHLLEGIYDAAESLETRQLLYASQRKVLNTIVSTLVTSPTNYIVEIFKRFFLTKNQKKIESILNL
jgi:hypothetical protein